MDKYTWVDVGSSYLPGEIIAAFLWAQMEEADAITRAAPGAVGRLPPVACAEAERAGRLRRPVVPDDCVHNAHMYYLLLPTSTQRTAVDRSPQGRGDPVGVPLRAAAQRPGRSTFGRTCGELDVTDDIAGGWFACLCGSASRRTKRA